MGTYQESNHDPVMLHKYLYAGNDPVLMVDPSGNSFSIGSLMSGIRALGALVSNSIGRIAGSNIGRAIGVTYVAGKQASLRLKIEVKNCRATNGKKCRIPNLVVIGSDFQEAQQYIADVQQGRGANGVPVSPQQTYKKGGNGGGGSVCIFIFSH